MRAIAQHIGGDRDRLVALIAEHRHTQAAHRRAIATEARRDLTHASARLAALTRAIEVAGRPELARALAAESRVGAALLVVLTTDDTTAAEVDQALRAYQQARHHVDALTGEPGVGTRREVEMRDQAVDTPTRSARSAPRAAATQERGALVQHDPE